jgi:hypothetical protein
VDPRRVYVVGRETGWDQDFFNQIIFADVFAENPAVNVMSEERKTICLLVLSWECGLDPSVQVHLSVE